MKALNLKKSGTVLVGTAVGVVGGKLLLKSAKNIEGLSTLPAFVIPAIAVVGGVLLSGSKNEMVKNAAMGLMSAGLYEATDSIPGISGVGANAPYVPMTTADLNQLPQASAVSGAESFQAVAGIDSRQAAILG